MSLVQALHPGQGSAPRRVIPPKALVTRIHRARRNGATTLPRNARAKDAAVPPNAAIAIICKVPKAGASKTRLIPALGVRSEPRICRAPS